MLTFRVMIIYLILKNNNDLITKVNSNYEAVASNFSDIISERSLHEQQSLEDRQVAYF